MVTVNTLKEEIENLDADLTNEYKEGGDTLYAQNLESAKEYLEDFLDDLDRHGITRIDKINVLKIVWNVDEAVDVDALPKNLEIDVTLQNLYLLEDINGRAERLCEYLTNEYGFCIRYFVANFE